MDCMKCGRRTQEKNVFCPDCLADMAKYPVKSDIPVILPQRKTKDRRSQRKTLKPEDTIAILQGKLKRLRICVAILLILFTASAGALGVTLYLHLTEPEYGTNYSTYSSTETTQAAQPAN